MNKRKLNPKFEPKKKKLKPKIKPFEPKETPVKQTNIRYLIYTIIGVLVLISFGIL